MFFSILTTTLTTILLTGLVSADQVDGLSVLLSTIIATILVFFFGEIIPKSFGKAFPNTISKVCIYPLYILGWILLPIGTNI